MVRVRLSSQVLLFSLWSLVVVWTGAASEAANVDCDVVACAGFGGCLVGEVEVVAVVVVVLLALHVQAQVQVPAVLFRLQRRRRWCLLESLSASRLLTTPMSSCTGTLIISLPGVIDAEARSSV